jgi:hypothetical protein
LKPRSIFGEIARHARALANVDGEHREATCIERAAQALDARHLLEAGRAPGRPEIHQQHAATVVLEALRLAFEGAQLERRRRAFPRLEGLRLRGQRAKREEKEQLHRPGNQRKPGDLPGFSLAQPPYFVAAFFSSALALDFFSPFALAFFSVFFSVFVGALGAVSDLGACANAVTANAEASNVTSSLFIFISSRSCWNDPLGT